MATSGAGRGRPRSADPAVLAIDALRVLDVRGYRETTMADVAREAGMSARTLHRYFATKADIVWGPIDLYFQQLQGRLDASAEDRELLASLREAIVGTFADYPESEEVVRMRLHLIGRTPELRANSSPPYDRWRHAIAEFVARRTGTAETDFLPVVIATAVQSTTMSALVWWAAQAEPGDPVVVVSESLLALEAGFSATLAR